MSMLCARGPCRLFVRRFGSSPSLCRLSFFVGVVCKEDFSVVRPMFWWVFFSSLCSVGCTFFPMLFVRGVPSCSSDGLGFLQVCVGYNMSVLFVRGLLSCSSDRLGFLQVCVGYNFMSVLLVRGFLSCSSWS